VKAFRPAPPTHVSCGACPAETEMFMATIRFSSTFLSLVLLAVLVAGASATGHAQAQPQTRMLVAHRGASAYAPEHTVAAYTLAMEQRADYVEQDLQITKDGQLVCLHDLTLDRTTNAKDVFPGRSRTLMREGRELTGWHVSDFTLAEIKQLDSGSWFNAKFKGQRILTFQEAIDLMKGKAGIYPETKAPEVYGSIGFDMEKLVMDVLVRNGLDKPGAVPKTPVVIQSFSAESLQKMKNALGVKLTLVFLLSDPGSERWLTREGMAEIKTFAAGIGPAKGIISKNPEVVKWAHQAGLTVTPYTFRSAGQAAGRNVRDEMSEFLYTFGVDALFTDNPDQFPRK
jgi:glycerophosphoryl diester phosphodiesterase